MVELHRSLVEQLVAHQATRAKSLFVSLWGDILKPHGEEFWLSGIIALAASLGINHRLVRTTMFRLTEEGGSKPVVWVDARATGSPRTVTSA